MLFTIDKCRKRLKILFIRGEMLKYLIAVFLFVTSAAEAFVDTIDATNPLEGSQSLDLVEVTGSRTAVELPEVTITGNREPINLNGIVKDNIPGLGIFENLAGREGASNPRTSQRAKPASSQNTSTRENCDGSPTTGAPVIIATGEKYKVEQDIIAQDTYALGLSRTYKSFGSYSFMFGNRWHSDYDYASLVISGCYRHEDYPNQCIPTAVTVRLPGGAVYIYESTSTNRFLFNVRGAAASGSMTFDPAYGWTLTTSDRIYKYSLQRYIKSVSTSGGTLLKNFQYGTDPVRPTSVSNAAGQLISFVYDPVSRFVTKVIDAGGNHWNYTYNGNILTSVTSPGVPSDVRTYHYESPNIDYSLLTGISINGSRYSTYSYYADKRVQVSGLTGGEERDQFAYGLDTTTVTDARGQSTTYQFIGAQGARKVSAVSRASTATCPSSASQTFYDSNGWKSYTLDWNGNRTNYTYDTAGNLLQTTSAVGTPAASTRVNTWTSGNLTGVVYRDAAGTAYASIGYTYVPSGFARGWLASERKNDLRVSASRTRSYTYAFHASGLLSSMTETQTLPTGPANTTFTYDTLGRLASVTNALGHQAHWTNYNGLRQAMRTTDSNGVSTDHTYFPDGKLTHVTQQLPSGARTTVRYHNNNRQVTDVAHPTGQVDRYRYNAAGRLEYVGDAAGYFARSEINVSGNYVRSSSPRHVPALSGSTPVSNSGGEFARVAYRDSLSRPYTEVGAAGQRLDYRYDNNGNLRTRTDAANRTTSYEYDAQNRLKKVTAADNGITLYGYDSEGNLQYVRDPRGLQTNYTYNGFGLLITAQSPDTGTTTYTYDSAGRLASESRADGRYITYGWDALNRPTSRTAGGITDSFTYDEGTYGKGRLSRLNDATGQTSFTYSGAGELIYQSNSIFGVTLNTSWTYDAAGRLTGMTYPSGLVLGYGYDGYGRLANITSNLGGTWSTIAGSMLYQPATNQR